MTNNNKNVEHEKKVSASIFSSVIKTHLLPGDETRVKMGFPQNESLRTQDINIIDHLNINTFCFE